MAFPAIALIISLLAGLFAYHLAERKRRNPRVWMIASVLLVVPLLLLAVLPAKRASRPTAPT